jgi:hypothetical protein
VRERERERESESKCTTERRPDGLLNEKHELILDKLVEIPKNDKKELIISVYQ